MRALLLLALLVGTLLAGCAGPEESTAATAPPADDAAPSQPPATEPPAPSPRNAGLSLLPFVNL